MTHHRPVESALQESACRVGIRLLMIKSTLQSQLDPIETVLALVGMTSIQSWLLPAGMLPTSNEQPYFASYSSKLLDFLPKTYNIQKWIFYPQLILHSTSKVLHPNFPVSLRRSGTYFLWEIKIPCLEHATFIPRKYLSFPNSFISNCVVNFSFKYNPPCSLETPIVLPILDIARANNRNMISIGNSNELLFGYYKLDVARANNRNMISIGNSNELLFGYYKGFPSEVDLFVKPFPVTMADPMLKLPLSCMTDRRLGMTEKTLTSLAPMYGSHQRVAVHCSKRYVLNACAIRTPNLSEPIPTQFKERFLGGLARLQRPKLGLGGKKSRISPLKKEATRLGLS
ncbi:hypothetical protein CR513_46635, partial [Mucuna pruriens]